jgi:hypothetical protein
MTVSTATLSGEWEVEFLPLKKEMVLKAGVDKNDVFTPQCNSWCKTQTVAMDLLADVQVASVYVETVHLAGQSDIGTFTISMFDEDLFGSLHINRRGKPFLGDRGKPNFWLEGRMTIKLQPKGSSEIISLVSRKPILQAGRADSWPPYNTVMHDVSGPNEYVPIDDPKGKPVLVLWSGAITIGKGPSPFLATDIRIHSFQYVETGKGNRVNGVELFWNDARSKVPLIDYYHVHKREFSIHQDRGPWERIGGNIKGSSFVDKSFDGSAPVTYKARQVFQDPFGDEVRGCGNETEFTVPAVPANREQLKQAGFR